MCKLQYAGETDRTLKDRFLDHRGYVRREELEKATGLHFNLPGHQISDITISVLERINTNDSATRKQRESHWIEQLELYTKGINRRRWQDLQVAIIYKKYFSYWYVQPHIRVLVIVKTGTCWGCYYKNSEINSGLEPCVYKIKLRSLPTIF